MTPPPQPTQLNGQLVTLEPLGTHDAAALLPSASDPEVWRWKLVPRPTSLADMEHLISQLLLGPGRLSVPLTALAGIPRCRSSKFPTCERWSG